VQKFNTFSLHTGEGPLFFNIVFITVNSHFPLLNKGTYSCPTKVALLLPQPLAHDVLQCLVICITVSSLAIFQSTKQVKIWRCKVRTVGHMKQVSIQILWLPQWCAYLYVAQHCHGWATHHTLFLWDILTRGNYLKFLAFQYNGQSSPCADVYTTEAITKSELTVLKYPPNGPDNKHHQIFTYSVLWKTTCKVTILHMIGHCKMPYVSG